MNKTVEIQQQQKQQPNQQQQQQQQQQQKQRQHLQQQQQKKKQQQLQQQQQQQQFSYPSTFDMEGIRLARKDNALRFLDETLPAMITRLRSLHRRSKAAADERLCADWKGPTATVGPSTAAKKRTFPGQLDKLVNSAKDLLQQHAELFWELQKLSEPLGDLQQKSDSELVVEKRQQVIEKKMTSNSKLLLKLTDEAEKLWKTHQIIHHANTQDEEDSQKESLEEARLILAHPIFKELRSEEEPMQEEEEEKEDKEEKEEEGEEEGGDTPADPLTPIANTLDLIDLVSDEMCMVIENSEDLRQWIRLYASPMDVVTDQEEEIRETVEYAIDNLLMICETSLDSVDDFLQNKAEIEALAIEKPLCLDRMRALDSYESTKAVAWRKMINAMDFQCIFIMDYILKHIKVLGRSQPEQSAYPNFYS